MTWRTPAGILVALVLVAAACGGSDASTSSGGPGGLGGESSTSSTASTQATTTGTHATTTSPAASSSGTNSGAGGASGGGGSATSGGGSSAANTGGAAAGTGGAGGAATGAGGAPACTTPNCATCASCCACAQCACGTEVNRCLTDTAGPGDPAGCLTCAQALLPGTPNGVCPSNAADLVAVAQCTCQPTTCDALCTQCPGGPTTTTTTGTTTATTTTASTGTGTVCKTCSQMIATEDTNPSDVCPNTASSTNTTDFQALVFCACGNGGACGAACGTNICIGQPVNPTCQACLVGVNGCAAPYNKCLGDTTP